ncbi:MAG: gamma-glutamyl-gamma-aminobutyrate hydrolase family protein [Eubacteriales bacterium]|nr:gamma-glutamyl-gamma-aminobutyrate hydrolase family protein [Eubacteriales bacterium]
MEKKLPIVGVTPLWDEEKQSLWMLPGYLDGLRQAGCLPVMLPLTEDAWEIDRLLSLVDGVLLTGGQDVSPELYGETPSDTVVTCKMRDGMETLVLQKAMELDKPVLGICRGIQFINVILGGTLYQDLPTQHPSQIKHCQCPPYDKPIHRVILRKDSPLYGLLRQDELSVNSYHHQAVKELARSLIPMAESEDGLVEAVYKPDQKFLWAVQWHPEFSYGTEESSRRIFAAFAKAMGAD